MNQIIPSVFRELLSEKLPKLYYWLNQGIASKSYTLAYLSRQVTNSK